MARLLSGAALIALAVAIVWFAPDRVFQLFAAVLVVLGVRELTALAAASDLHVSAFPVHVSALLTAGVVGLQSGYALEVALMAALVAIGLGALGSWRGGASALGTVSAALFPSLYIGLPIGALVAIRAFAGPRVLFLLMLTVMVSDTAQYYSGRAFGRRPLAPAISPKKTIEGALGGLLCGTTVFVVMGAWWVPGMPALFRAAVGLAVVALGIAGDLFESMLKRSAGVKDSSGLIPGHGGVLDRIDALLFAAPVYYIVLKYV
ncbi:MAG: phosphatidate cytidylyltransferase [Vicinamibacterales bacterium]